MKLLQWAKSTHFQSTIYYQNSFLNQSCELTNWIFNVIKTCTIPSKKWFLSSNCFRALMFQIAELIKDNRVCQALHGFAWSQKKKSFLWNILLPFLLPWQVPPPTARKVPSPTALTDDISSCPGRSQVSSLPALTCVVLSCPGQCHFLLPWQVPSPPFYLSILKVHVKAYDKIYQGKNLAWLFQESPVHSAFPLMTLPKAPNIIIYYAELTASATFTICAWGQFPA